MKNSLALPGKGKTSMINFLVIAILGYVLLLSQNLRGILIGFALILLAIHEVGHILAFIERGYTIQGVYLTVLGPEVRPDRPITREDSTLIYLSGLFSLILPILVFIFNPKNSAVVFILILFSVTLSIVDIKYWLDILKDANAEKTSA